MFGRVLDFLSHHMGFWSPVRRIYGGPEGKNRSLYLTRVNLSPLTPWGQLWLHVFHRHDVDRDPHDHPFSFWTFPLSSSYVEEVFDAIESAPQSSYPAVTIFAQGRHCFRQQTVTAWRWHHRPATHKHRILSTVTGRWPLVTLVWRGPSERKWGFWCYDQLQSLRSWVHFKHYSINKANITGVSDEHCG